MVLVRDGDNAPELFMVRRHERASFGDAFAFPGGVLEADDRTVHERCSGISAQDARTLLRTENGLDYFSSAIRELFEETGVLLADRREQVHAPEQARASLNDNSMSWQRFVESNDLVLRCDELEYFSYWVTPDPLPQRYSTRFFLAELPAGQQASHCGGELTDSRWMTARDVLAAGETDDMLLHFPTLVTLEKIAAYDSVSELKSWCRGCQEEGVDCIHPQLIDGRPVIE